MVLVVVHSVAAGERALAAVEAIESEPGVQVVFSQPPGPADNHVANFLSAAGALTTPWERAAKERFDLVISTSPTGVGPLRGALLLLPEVSQDGKIVDHHGRSCVPALTSLLRHRTDNNEVVIGLPHDAAVATLHSASRDAGRRAVIIGDPGYDHLLDALAHRDDHRERLQIRAGQRLGLVVSTRGPDSLLGRSPALFNRLLTDPSTASDRLICHLDPDVWVRHGARQVLAWAGRRTRSRVRFLRLGQGWQAPLAAADYVVGDHGALTAYAAAAGMPVYLANPMPSTAANSLGEAVARYSTHLDPAVPLGDQFAWTARPSRPVAQRVTSVPGRSTDLLRSQCLHLLRVSDSAPLRAEDR